MIGSGERRFSASMLSCCRGRLRCILPKNFACGRLSDVGAGGQMLADLAPQGVHLDSARPTAGLYDRQRRRLKTAGLEAFPGVGVGSCPSRSQRDSHPSLPSVIGQHPSRGERPVGRQRTFVPGHVATRIHPMTGWPSLLPTSSTRTPIGLPDGSRSQREMDGVPTFHCLSPSG